MGEVQLDWEKPVLDDPKACTHVGRSLLQSTEHRDLLDIIDSLRSQGIGRYVDLPQIAVCGDQSSGKSSALEAISGMSFPTKDNLCTRFATELVLRRSSTTGVNIGITPGHDRSEAEKESLSKFTHAFADGDVGKVVDDAKEAMGLTSNGRVFSSDILRVEISGPTQPHLTMVDLPGLFLAGNKDQSEEDAKVVEELVLSYMRNPRTIILAVVSAKSDFALQQVTRHARAQDPSGIRTLGLITKPDTLDVGSESEGFYLELAQNKDVKFQLGWHVLRNRSYGTRETSATERDMAEAEFFSSGVWTSLKASQTGVAALRLRLSNVLRHHILKQLPHVLSEIHKGINESERTLGTLGESRGTISKQRRYLLKAGTTFSHLIKAAIDGVYVDAFFGSPRDQAAYSKRLRAVVQNKLLGLAESMRASGHAFAIVDGPVSPQPNRNDERFPRLISRTTYYNEVVLSLLKKSRGRELPGTYNPMIVGELFAEQCQPWEGLIRGLTDRTIEAAVTTVEAIIYHVVDEVTANRMLGDVIYPALDQTKEQLNIRVEEILKPHLHGHPITYNHYLTDNFQKAQNERTSRAIESKLRTYLEVKQGDTVDYAILNVKDLTKSLVGAIETNMDRWSCSMATDMMLAYYKVALKNVIDDVSALAVEEYLQKLQDVFSAEVICDLDDERVQLIAAENSESAEERSRVEKKLCVLRKGIKELERVKQHRLPTQLSDEH